MFLSQLKHEKKSIFKFLRKLTQREMKYCMKFRRRVDATPKWNRVKKKVFWPITQVLKILSESHNTFTKRLTRSTSITCQINKAEKFLYCEHFEFAARLLFHCFALTNEYSIYSKAIVSYGIERKFSHTNITAECKSKIFISLRDAVRYLSGN